MINENVIRLLRIFFPSTKKKNKKEKNNKCQMSSMLMKIYFVNNKM